MKTDLSKEALAAQFPKAARLGANAGGGARDEFNVCGMLLHVRPAKVESVSAALRRMPGLEIHHVEPDGRLIITIEDTEAGWAGETATAVHNVPGVLNASLVYHHNDIDPGEEVSQ